MLLLFLVGLPVTYLVLRLIVWLHVVPQQAAQLSLAADTIKAIADAVDLPFKLMLMPKAAELFKMWLQDMGMPL